MSSLPLFLDVHWQLPTYNGTKSYQNLLVGVYGAKDTGSNRDTSIQRKPLEFIRNGYYQQDNSIISARSVFGLYWVHAPFSIIYAKGLYIASTLLAPQYVSHSKSNGYSIRCLVR